MKWGWLLLAMMALAACDDTSGKGGDDDGPPQRDLGPRPPPLPEDGGVPDAEPDAAPDAAEPDAAPERYRLEIEGDARVTVFHGQQAALVVRYLGADDQPIAGEVRVKMLDASGADRTAGGIDGSTLAGAAVVAGADGRATFTLTAGPTAANFTVEAEADNADPVSWRVSVTHAPTGGVRVRVTYDAQAGRYPLAALAEADVAIFVNETCDSLQGPNAPAPIDTPPVIDPFDGDDTTQSGALPHGVQVTTLARGISTTGATIAWGCTEGVRIGGGGQAEITVALGDMPLEFKGVYQVEHHLNLTDLLENANNGQLGEVVLVLDILGALGGGYGDLPFPRGDGLIRLACEQGGIDDAVCDPIRLLAAPIVEDFVNNLLPPELLDALNVLGDLYRIVADMTVLGEMEFVRSYADAEGLLPGNESRWQGFRFLWRNGCNLPPEECFRDFSLVEAGVGARTLVGVFDARLVEGDVLEIGAHQIRVHVGRLALALAERWLLPAMMGVEGPVTVDDFLLQLVPCADINAAIPPGNPNSGVCEQLIVRPLADQLRLQIENIGVGLDTFTFQGRVKAVDRIPDTRTDRLVDGVWDANFGNVGDLIPGAGTFSGCRNDFCEEPAP